MAAGVHGIRGFFRQMKTSSMAVSANTVTIAGGAGGGIGGAGGGAGKGKGSALGAIATVAAVGLVAVAAVQHGDAERAGATERLEDQRTFADEAGAGTVERVNRLRQERSMAAELAARSGVGNSTALKESSARLEEAQQQLAQNRVEEIGDDPLALFNKALEVLKGDDDQRQTAEKFQEAMALFVNKGIAVDVKVEGPGSASVSGSPLVRGDSGGQAA